MMHFVVLHILLVSSSIRLLILALISHICSSFEKVLSCAFGYFSKYINISYNIVFYST
ncbi:hypothetical protein T492DRAFT_998814 [Pavlovales sp. CCMP2436]|nr:hypothetical protein T492DRAFT_998814 [Pavlovales sp. CCMP2436]